MTMAKGLSKGTSSHNLRRFDEIPCLEKLQRTLGNFEAICFDMDGTLLNSEPLHAMAVWNMLPTKPVVVGDNTFYNADQLNDFFCGKSDDSVFEALRLGQDSWQSWGVQDFSEIKNRSLMIQSDSAVSHACKDRLNLLEKSLSPMMMDLLREIKSKKIPCALVSASQKEVVEDFVMALGLGPYFDTLVGAADGQLTKPHPDPYLKACEMLGVSPGETIVFEDSQTGLESARRAGCIVLQAAWYNAD